MLRMRRNPQVDGKKSPNIGSYNETLNVGFMYINLLHLVSCFYAFALLHVCLLHDFCYAMGRVLVLLLEYQLL